MKWTLFRMASDLTGNYADKLRSIWTRTQDPAVASIRHDDWCGTFKGRVCDCDPDVLLMRPLDDASEGSNARSHHSPYRK